MAEEQKKTQEIVAEKEQKEKAVEKAAEEKPAENTEVTTDVEEGQEEAKPLRRSSRKAHPITRLSCTQQYSQLPTFYSTYFYLAHSLYDPQSRKNRTKKSKRNSRKKKKDSETESESESDYSESEEEKKKKTTKKTAAKSKAGRKGRKKRLLEDSEEEEDDNSEEEEEKEEDSKDKKKSTKKPAPKKATKSKKDSDDDDDDTSDDDDVKKPERKRRKKGGVEELVMKSTIYEKLSKEQLEYLNKLKVDELKNKLRSNSCSVSNLTKENLKRKIAYNVVYGVPERCPKCFGGILKRASDGSIKNHTHFFIYHFINIYDFLKNLYILFYFIFRFAIEFFCPGYYDDDHYVSCSFHDDAKVIPWAAEKDCPL